jgi:acetylornithine deacetylase
MSMADADRAAALLVELIGHRTANPGGDEIGLCARLGQELAARGADHVDVVEVPRDPGVGAYVLARWGEPRTLVNIHLDTVPPNRGWTRDPFEALVAGGRVVGLGAADTKGAIASLLVALEQQRPTNLGVLLSGDEERTGTCVRSFLGDPAAAQVKRAIVCEPTSRGIGVRHRGILAYRAELRGRGGHSSLADHMPKPIVALARLAVALDELGAAHLDHGPDGMKGLCLNVASLEGGVAFNVVPDRAQLLWSLRPPPGFDVDAWAAAQARCAAAADPAIEILPGLHNPPFACRDPESFAPLLGDALARSVGLDFWTEAAVLSAAGIDCVVVGPGDIGQAHAAGEHVTLDDLGWAVELMRGVLRASGRC